MLRFQSHQHTSGSSDKTGGFNTVSTFSYRATYYGLLYYCLSLWFQYFLLKLPKRTSWPRTTRNKNTVRERWEAGSSCCWLGFHMFFVCLWHCLARLCQETLNSTACCSSLPNTRSVSVCCKGWPRCLESQTDFQTVASPDEGHGLSESEFQVPVYSSDITQDGNITKECLSEYLVTPQVLSHRRAITMLIQTFWRAWSLNNKGHLIPVLASDELPSPSVKVVHHIISHLIISKL